MLSVPKVARWRAAKSMVWRARATRMRSSVSYAESTDGRGCSRDEDMSTSTRGRGASGLRRVHSDLVTKGDMHGDHMDGPLLQTAGTKSAVRGGARFGNGFAEVQRSWGDCVDDQHRVGFTGHGARGGRHQRACRTSASQGSGALVEHRSPKVLSSQLSLLVPLRGAAWEAVAAAAVAATATGRNRALDMATATAGAVSAARSPCADGPWLPRSSACRGGWGWPVGGPAPCCAIARCNRLFCWCCPPPPSRACPTLPCSMHPAAAATAFGAGAGTIGAQLAPASLHHSRSSPPQRGPECIGPERSSSVRDPKLCRGAVIRHDDRGAEDMGRSATSACGAAAPRWGPSSVSMLCRDGARLLLLAASIELRPWRSRAWRRSLERSDVLMDDSFWAMTDREEEEALQAGFARRPALLRWPWAERNERMTARGGSELGFPA